MAAIGGGSAGVLVAVGVVLAVRLGWSFGLALDAFVVTNGLMGVAFGGCGAMIAWHRPRKAVGWLLLAGGLCHAITAAGVPAASALAVAGAPEVLVRVILTVAGWTWPWSIGLTLPLALTLFPDGRLPSPRWRLPVVAVTATTPLFVLSIGADPGPVSPGEPVAYLGLPGYADLTTLWTVAEVRNLAAIGLAIAALLVRYRRGDERQRRQLLWLVLATIVALALIVPWVFVAGTPVVVLAAIPLIPLAVTVAIVRERLLDIRLAISRALAWVLLSAAVLAVYSLLVALLDEAVSDRVGRSTIGTILLVLLVAPILPPVQRLVERAMYGDRRDLARAISRVGRQLGTGALDDLAAAVRDALRLPYVAITTGDGVLGAAGTEDDGPRATVPLDHGAERVGELVVALRPGERDLAARDHDVLALVAAPLAVAIHATRLSADLRSSRGRIVTAREEERRRLRRDLHDGLGPTLTGVALTADAAANLVGQDPDEARKLLATLRCDVRTAIGDIRRLVDDLRPPALDDLGLVEALRSSTQRLTHRADGTAIAVRLEVPEPLPALPAAIEVATYRVAAEALTNIVRHSTATAAVVRLSSAATLELAVRDNGVPSGGNWPPGIGLRAMRERADELGGRLSAGPVAGGGEVRLSLPLQGPA